MNKQEIIENLLLCDEYFPVMHPGKEMELIIVGGAAFALHGVDKVTYDIDTVTNLGEARDFLFSFAINDDARNVCILPTGFEERVRQIEIGTSNLRILIPSMEDLIALKLQRFDQKDRADILLSGFLDVISWSELSRMAEEIPAIKKNFSCFLKEITDLGVA